MHYTAMLTSAVFCPGTWTEPSHGEPRSQMLGRRKERESTEVAVAFSIQPGGFHLLTLVDVSLIPLRWIDICEICDEGDRTGEPMVGVVDNE